MGWFPELVAADFGSEFYFFMYGLGIVHVYYSVCQLPFQTGKYHTDLSHSNVLKERSLPKSCVIVNNFLLFYTISSTFRNILISLNVVKVL